MKTVKVMLSFFFCAVFFLTTIGCSKRMSKTYKENEEPTSEVFSIISVIPTPTLMPTPSNRPTSTATPTPTTTPISTATPKPMPTPRSTSTPTPRTTMGSDVEPVKENLLSDEIRQEYYSRGINLVDAVCLEDFMNDMYQMILTLPAEESIARAQGIYSIFEESLEKFNEQASNKTEQLFSEKVSMIVKRSRAIPLFMALENTNSKALIEDFYKKAEEIKQAKTTEQLDNIEPFTESDSEQLQPIDPVEHTIPIAPEKPAVPAEAGSELTTNNCIAVESILIVNSLSIETMKLGTNQSLIVNIYPSNATDKTLYIQTSNPAVVMVWQGTNTLTAMTEGTAIITITSTNGVSAKCTVTVAK